MKNDLTVGGRIKAVRDERGETQAEFGEGLGASQGAVSAWERDDKDRAPSADIYFRIANLASDPADSLFFLEQAKLTPQAIVSVANKIGKDQIVRPKGDEFIAPRPLRGETKAEHPDVLFRAGILPDSSSLEFLTIDRESAGYGLAPGDTVIVDTSQADAPYLKTFFGRDILGRSSDGQYCMGNVVFKALHGTVYRWGAALTHPNPADPRCLKIVAEYASELATPLHKAEPEAWDRMARPPGFQILGVVIAWLPAQKSEQPPPEDVYDGSATLEQKLQTTTKASTVLVQYGVEIIGEGAKQRREPLFKRVSFEGDMKSVECRRGPTKLGDANIYYPHYGDRLFFDRKTGALIAYAGVEGRKR